MDADKPIHARAFMITSQSQYTHKAAPHKWLRALWAHDVSQFRLQLLSRSGSAYSCLSIFYKLFTWKILFSLHGLLDTAHIWNVKLCVCLIYFWVLKNIVLFIILFTIFLYVVFNCTLSFAHINSIRQRIAVNRDKYWVTTTVYLIQSHFSMGHY